MLIASAAPPPLLAESIPRRLHQIWLGGRPLPARWEDFSKRLQAMNPDWEYHRWADADADALLFGTPYEPAYRAWSNPGFRSDILRLLILQQVGGVYLDTDCEPVRPLSPLLAGRMGFIGATFSPQPIVEVLVENAVMAACPGHPFLEAALTAAMEGCALFTAGDFARGVPNVVQLTGPAMLSRVLMQYRQSPASVALDFSVLPSFALYPVVPGGRWQYEARPAATPDEFPGTFLIHWWDGSWVREQEAQKQLAREQQRTQINKPGICGLDADAMN